MLTEARLQNFLVTPAKQAAAVLVGVAALVLACTGAYLVLLLVAVVTNTGLGSPLLLVLVPVGSALLATFYAIIILAPVTWLAEWLCRSRLGWPWWAQAFVALPLMTAYLFALGSIAGMMAGGEVLAIAVQFAL